MLLINSRDGRGRPCQLLEPFVRSLARVVRLLLCCVLRQPIHYLVSRNRNNSSAHSFSNLSLFVCNLYSTEATINSARRSNISALRLCGGFKSNFVSVPFDDTVVPVIFSYRRMCIWDAKLSLGDVSQSAEWAPSGKRCGERAKGQGWVVEGGGRQRCFVITVADKWSRDSLIPSNYIWWGPFTPDLSWIIFGIFGRERQQLCRTINAWFSLRCSHEL